MRDAIPPKDHQSVADWMREALPNLEPKVLAELTADYLLPAGICIDIEDLRYALTGMGWISTQAIFDVPIDQVVDATMRLVHQATALRDGSSIRSIVLVFRASLELKLTHISAVMRQLDVLFESEQRLLLYGSFLDPQASGVKIRVFVAG